jgi:hypothetical protein
MYENLLHTKCVILTLLGVSPSGQDITSPEKERIRMESVQCWYRGGKQAQPRRITEISGKQISRERILVSWCTVLTKL